jgi:hypothetical protein
MRVRRRNVGAARFSGPALEERQDALRGVCFCLLYDLCAWVARAHRPVPVEVREYRLDGIRDLPDPPERLRHYLNPDLLSSWEAALRPFFEAGAALLLEVGEAAPLGAEGLHEDGDVRAELRFSERSSLIDSREGRHPLPRRQWLLELWLSADLKRVERARLRAL